MTKEIIWPDKEVIGVMFRYQDVDNYYLLRWKRNGMRSCMYLDEVVGGTHNNIAKKFEYLMRTNWYTLDISLSGANILIKVNDNRNDIWKTVFDLSDSSHNSGSIALYSWRNRQAWFDDVLVTESDDDILLEDGFDHGKFYSWIAMAPPGEEPNWDTTKRLTDQEDFYVMPDFVYRELLLIGHYKEDNIYYLNADKWRDVDGDGANEVRKVTTDNSLKFSLKEWLNQDGHPDKNNHLNLVYIFDHGMNGGIRWGIKLRSYITVDSNRDGDCGDLPDAIYSNEIDRWLPNYSPIGIGRLSFIVEACFIGQFVDEVGGHPLQNRITIASTSWDTSAGGETGQDWPAFSHMLFKTLASGETNFANAFNVADKHVDVTNFLSIWCCKNPYTDELVPTDSKLDDNGDKIGHDYYLPNNNDGCLAIQTGL